MGKFSLDLNKHLKSMGKSVDRVTDNVVISVTDKVQDFTPYGKPELWKSPAPEGYEPGALKGNWQFAEGRPNLSTSSSKDTTGNNSKGKVRGALKSSSSNRDKTYYFTNNLPHAVPVEFGHSRIQAPAGMLRRGVAVFQTTVSREAKKERQRA